MTTGEMPPPAVMASPRFSLTQLPRVASPHECVQDFVGSASPVIFTPDRAKTNAGHLLTPGDLRHAFGDEAVTVIASEGGVYRSDSGSKSSGRRMPFAEFADFVETSDRNDGERLYLAQFPLDIMPLILGSGAATPASYIPDGSSMVSNNLWFGPAGTITPLHFDRSHNLLHQHAGIKHVIMLDPSCSHLMRPGSKNGKSPHVSSLDLVTPGPRIDLSRLDAPCAEATLGPGDILFIPAFWWHHVISVEAAISINFWWRPPISACLHPNFFRMLSSGAVYRDPSIVAQWVDVAPHRIDTALCLFLAGGGHMFAAAALAGALVTAFCGKALRALGIPGSSRPAQVAGDVTGPDFAAAAAVIPALTRQGLIGQAQSALLLEWLELAEETAVEPEPRPYTQERSTAIGTMIGRLHVELGQWL